jgi:eukaryotic translation initiation factor 2C
MYVLIVFNCPRRLNFGREGRSIALRANLFKISFPQGFLHHYGIEITPDLCSRVLNREIIQSMVSAFKGIFGCLRPVFDGQKNLYTRDPLPISENKIELEVSMFCF